MITAAFRTRATTDRITRSPLGSSLLAGLDLLQLGHRLLEPIGRPSRIEALAGRIESRIEPQCLLPKGDRGVDLPAGVGVQAVKIQCIDLFRNIGAAEIAQREGRLDGYSVERRELRGEVESIVDRYAYQLEVEGRADGEPRIAALDEKTGMKLEEIGDVDQGAAREAYRLGLGDVDEVDRLRHVEGEEQGLEGRIGEAECRVGRQGIAVHRGA